MFVAVSSVVSLSCVWRSWWSTAGALFCPSFFGLVWHTWWSAAGALFCPSFFGSVWHSWWSVAGALFCPSFFGLVWNTWWSAAGALFCPGLVGFSPTIYHSKLNWHRPQVYDSPDPAHSWSQPKLWSLRTTYELPMNYLTLNGSFTTSSANIFSSLPVYCVEIF